MPWPVPVSHHHHYSLLTSMSGSAAPFPLTSTPAAVPPPPPPMVVPKPEPVEDHDEESRQFQVLQSTLLTPKTEEGAQIPPVDFGTHNAAAAAQHNRGLEAGTASPPPLQLALSPYCPPHPYGMLSEARYQLATGGAPNANANAAAATQNPAAGMGFLDSHTEYTEEDLESMPFHVLQTLMMLTPKPEPAPAFAVATPNADFAAGGWHFSGFDPRTAPQPLYLPTTLPTPQLLQGTLPEAAAATGQTLASGFDDLSNAATATSATISHHLGEDVHAEYYRLLRLFLDYSATTGIPPTSVSPFLPSSLAPPTAASTLLQVPQTPNPHDDLIQAVARVKKRKKQPPGSKRSTELVRLTPGQDLQHSRHVVRRTLAIYQSLRLILAREDDKGGAFIFGTPHLPGQRLRADMVAASVMKDKGLWLNRDKRYVGAVPGVLMGDIYMYRMEMCVVGLHGQVQGGIDYVPGREATNGEPLATSIVVSAAGGYEDDEDTGNVIVYTGHGGRDHNMKRHSTDQKLERANLGLERSMKYGIEVRVIRGFPFDGSPTGKVYIYDGLYKVVKVWKDTGKSGFTVYKFKLVRLAGQVEMGSMVLKLAEELKQLLLSAAKNDVVAPAPLPGYLCLDLSNGKELLPVTVFNDVDEDRDPLRYQYLPTPVYPSSHSPLLRQQPNNIANHQYRGCQCATSCCSSTCFCVLKNGGEFPYDLKSTLIAGKPLVYECGPLCGCPLTCRNRVAQLGLRHRLEVFQCRETRSWRLRSLDIILAGSFICEYSGIVFTEQQSQQTELLRNEGRRLVFPNMFRDGWVEWGDIARVVPQHQRPASSSVVVPQLSYSIDVSQARNVACYLSHSSRPNVFPQFVLYDHYDTSYPHVMIFALENIPPFRELTMDYGIRDNGWLVKTSSSP